MFPLTLPGSKERCDCSANDARGAALAAGAVWRGLAASLGGCASLPFFGDKRRGRRRRRRRAADRAEYELEVDAPTPLRKLLLDYLDLARFQNAPRDRRASPAPSSTASPRAAPAQARALLETEGYFNAEVKVARSDARRRPAARCT